MFHLDKTHPGPARYIAHLCDLDSVAELAAGLIGTVITLTRYVYSGERDTLPEPHVGEVHSIKIDRHGGALLVRLTRTVGTTPLLDEVRLAVGSRGCCFDFSVEPA